jgi:hypothetical protein
MAGLPVRFAPAQVGDQRLVGYLVPARGSAPASAMQASPVEGALMSSGAMATSPVLPALPAGEAAQVPPIDEHDGRLGALLEQRHTARTPHMPRPVGDAIVRALQAEARRYGCALFIRQDGPAIKRLAALARRATAAQLADPEVHAELWRWLRLNPRDPAYRRDGLTADCLELRGVTLLAARLVLPPARMHVLARLHAQHLLAVDTQRVVARSASLCLLTAPSEQRDDLLLTGRALQRIWLLAAAAGLTTHPVSALLDCADTAGAALAVFGAVGRVAGSLFRLGFTPPVARAPRLPLAELLDRA